MLVNAANVAEIFRNFRVVFLEAFHGAGTPVYDELAMVVQSNGELESYDWLGAMPTLRELIGEIQVRNLSAVNWKILNREFENTIGLKRKDMERDRLGIYSPILKTMGDNARRYPDRMVAKLLADGFTNKDYTGKNFFDTAKKGLPDSKYPFTNMTTKKLSADNFAIGRQNILERRASNGEPMDLGRDLLLLVSPKNEALAKQILQNDLTMTIAKNVAGTENVAAAAVGNVNKGTARLKVWPLLSQYNTDAWFVMEQGLPLKSLIVQIELPAEVNGVTNINDSHVVLKQEFLFQAYTRLGAGYGMPELIYGSTGADAA